VKTDLSREMDPVGGVEKQTMIEKQFPLPLLAACGLIPIGRIYRLSLRLASSPTSEEVWLAQPFSPATVLDL